MKPFSLKKLDQKPLPPAKRYKVEHRISVGCGDNLQDIINRVPDGVDPRDCLLREEPTYYDDFDLFFTCEMIREVPEKTYLARVKKYEKELNAYNKLQEKKT